MRSNGCQTLGCPVKGWTLSVSSRAWPELESLGGLPLPEAPPVEEHHHTKKMVASHKTGRIAFRGSSEYKTHGLALSA